MAEGDVVRMRSERLLDGADAEIEFVDRLLHVRVQHVVTSIVVS